MPKIDVLEEVDNACLQEIKDYPREKNATDADAVDMWDKTVWHKIIQNKITELSKLI